MSHFMSKYPRISDLQKQAEKRLPPFVGAYLFAGTGQNEARDRSVEDYGESLTWCRAYCGGAYPPHASQNSVRD